jgi:DNA polymerase-3 subunit epsilon
MIYYLDTETTGLYRSEGAEIVELAVLRDDGEVVINSLVKPKKPIPKIASYIHGITDDMVSDAPLFADIRKQVYKILKNQEVVIYNAQFDLQWLPRLYKTSHVSCCMLEYAYYYGEFDEYHQSYRWHKLTEAARHIGYSLPPDVKPHRALADCLLTRAVWHYMRDNPRSHFDDDYDYSDI